MTWLLLIQVVRISTCREGFRCCPPARPPVESRQVLQTEAACQARAQQYRRSVPAERALTRRAHLRMPQQTTVQVLDREAGRPLGMRVLLVKPAG